MYGDIIIIYFKILRVYWRGIKKTLKQGFNFLSDTRLAKLFHRKFRTRGLEVRDKILTYGILSVGKEHLSQQEGENTMSCALLLLTCIVRQSSFSQQLHSKAQAICVCTENLYTCL